MWLTWALACSLATAQASPSYERYLPITSASDPERQLRQVARAWGHRHGHGLAYDWRLGRAAQALLPWAQAHAGAPLPIEVLREAAWAQGWTDGELTAVAISSRPGALPMALALQLEHALPEAEANQLGLALAIPSASHEAPEQATVVVALSRRLVQLAPTPQRRAPGGQLHLLGRVTAPHVVGVTVAAQHPDGTLSRQPLALAHGHFAGSLPMGLTPGAMHVELLVERGRGPEVAAAFPVAVGHAPPEAAGHAQAHGKSLLALVWGLRDSHGLPLPAPHPSLMQVAQAHGQDMQAHHFFAHVSPTTGDVTRRLQALGLGYRHVVENIAQGADLSDAFAQWLQSPGHLQNLLDPQVTHVGVALVADGHDVLAVLVMASLQ